MPDLIRFPFAQNGDKSAPPATDPQGFVNFDQGYTAFYELDLASNDPNAKAVERNRMNYLFWLLSDNLKAWQQTAVPPWFSNMEGGYAVNAMVQIGNVIYRSLVDRNTANPSSAGNTGWEVFETTTLLKSYNQMPWGGAQGPAFGSITTSFDFNNLLNGTWFVTTTTLMAGAANRPPFTNANTTGLLSAYAYSNAQAQQFGFQTLKCDNGETWTREIKANVFGRWRLLVDTAQVQLGTPNFGELNGNNGTYTMNLVPSLSSYVVGSIFRARVLGTTNANGAATININGLGAIPIYKYDLTPLSGYEIPAAGGYVEFVIWSSGTTTVARLTNNVGDYADSWFGKMARQVLNMGIQRSLVPIGFPMYCPSNAIPPNYIKYNGGSFDPAVYPELRAILNSNVTPDCRALVIRGLDDGRNIDTGRQILSFQDMMIQSHLHTGTTNNAGAHTHTATADIGGDHNHTGSTNQAGAHSHNGTAQHIGDHQHYIGWGENWIGPYGASPYAGQAGSGKADGDNYNWLSQPNGAHSHPLLIATSGVHSHTLDITMGGSHTHTVTVNSAGEHNHGFTTQNTGGVETRMKNIAFVVVARAR